MACLTVHFSTAKERETVWSFLQQFDWKTLYQTEHLCTSSLQKGENLPILQKASRIIGLQGEPVSQWGWALMAWLACHSTFRKNDMRVLYHDHEEIPVFVASQNLGPHVLVVNQHGQLLNWRGDISLKSSNIFSPNFVEQQHFIQQINQQWEKQFPPKRKYRKKS